MLWCTRTTLSVHDTLLHKAKEVSAQRNVSVGELVEVGLRVTLAACAPVRAGIAPMNNLTTNLRADSHRSVSSRRGWITTPDGAPVLWRYTACAATRTMSQRSRNQMIKVAILLGVALTGVFALTIQHLLRPAPFPPDGEYFLTNLAVLQIGVISIPIALGSVFAFGFYIQAPPVLVGFSIVTIFPIISLYEAQRYPGSHNLLPFELIPLAICATPFMLVAWAGCALARRSRRQSIWSGKENAV